MGRLACSKGSKRERGEDRKGWELHEGGEGDREVSDGDAGGKRRKGGRHRMAEVE